MFPLLPVGKAWQEQLLQLVESSSDALQRETAWFERTDWKEDQPLIIVRARHTTIFPRDIVPNLGLLSGKAQQL